MALLAVLGAGWLLASRTPFGRCIYAMGGMERSARVMGLPVARTRIAVYSIAGACSALAGFVFTLYKEAGDPASAVGLELDVIASVVIGGTLLSGGVGSIPGTLMGVLILGLIRLIIDFQGNLNAAWTSIATGILLLVFLGVQKAVGSLGARAAFARTN
jgi:simple sugar transport system permease protein